jgi:transposase
MISADKRQAIYQLHKEGMPEREIARSLRVNRGSVRAIIEQKGQMPESTRSDKIHIDEQLLIKLYKDCDGWVQRVHEKLTEEEGIQIGYSTLTLRIRELGLGRSKPTRCGRVEDKAGEEMQHDTSAYKVKLGIKRVLLQASLLYFRYSKIRYLKFYPSFDRFKMKCFFHEALSFWGYAADICIIDNTSLARLYGTGKNAVIAPEMQQFAKQYGFEFVCHEIRHSNRKAGTERGFFTIVTNFFAGRKFESLKDLNQQAFGWATVRSANRPTGKTRLVPASAFEYEKAYLNKLPAYVQAPYLVHKRRTDQYGYVAFDGNFYWIPGSQRHDVKVLQYQDHLKIYHQRKFLGLYELPAYGVKNEQFSPKGQPKPKHQPKYRKKPTSEEEKILRTADKHIDAYLSFVLKEKSGKAKHRFIRQLYALYKKMALSLLIKTLTRALKYRISDIKTIESIAGLLIREANYDMPTVEISVEFKNRDVYRQGRFAGRVNLSAYDKLMEEDEDEDDQ